MIALCKKVATHPQFESFILALIVVNGVALGFETFPEFAELYDDQLVLLYLLSQIIFSIEIAIRVIAYGPTYRKFFQDGWNVIDFAIVAVCWLPASGPFVSVSRLFRLLRLVRLVSVNDELREFVSSLLVGFRSLGYLAVLFSLVSYVYAILGTFLFGEAQPMHWGNLFLSLQSLIRLLTRIGPSPFEQTENTIGLNVFVGSYLLLALFCMASLIAMIVRKGSPHRPES